MIRAYNAIIAAVLNTIKYSIVLAGCSRGSRHRIPLKSFRAGGGEEVAGIH